SPLFRSKCLGTCCRHCSRRPHAAGVGSAAMADYPEDEDNGQVDVNVDISDGEPQGALSLTVAGDETTLTEDGTTAEYRQFTGALPEVTVTDTRSDVPAGAYWYVTGQASSFVGSEGQTEIEPGHLGWAPDLLTDGEGEGGEVAPGAEVDTVLDESDDTPNNNVGLVDEELLTMSLDSGDAQAASGSWTASADLVLKTQPDVEPGSYTSVITLSLFEDAL